MSTEDEEDEEEEDEEEHEDEQEKVDGDIDKVLQLVQELQRKDMEEHRRRIEDRDRRGERTKAEARTGGQDMDRGGERSRTEGQDRRTRTEEVHTEPEARPAVFIFDQEDIETSKLLTFDKVCELSQSVSRLVRRSVSQPVSQSVSEVVSRSVTQSVG